MLTKDWKRIFWVTEGFMIYCYRSRDDYYYNPRGQKIKKQVELTESHCCTAITKKDYKVRVM